MSPKHSAQWILAVLQCGCTLLTMLFTVRISTAPAGLSMAVGAVLAYQYEAICREDLTLRLSLFSKIRIICFWPLYAFAGMLLQVERQPQSNCLRYIRSRDFKQHSGL